MSRNKDYQRLLNSKRWKELRQWKLQQNPLCEICRAKGLVRSAIDVHHIDPAAPTPPAHSSTVKNLSQHELSTIDGGCHIGYM